eukprot:221256_1
MLNEQEQQVMIKSDTTFQTHQIEENPLSNNVESMPLRKDLFEEFDPESTGCKCNCPNAMPPIEMINNLKSQPSFLIDGKWSPISYIFLILFIIGMSVAVKYVIAEYPSYTEPNPSYITNFIWRFIIFIYGICILLYILKIEGLWPLWSFTMMSWNLFTFRYFVSSLYHLGCDSAEFPIFFALSEIFRYPSLVCNTITVSVWWIVLTPLICAVYIWQGPTREYSMKRIKEFLKFNVGPVFINIHFLNLPLSALDHILDMRVLTLFDLWMGMLIGLCYVIMYLFVMDKKGLYFYHVLLSPRPHWCFLAYAFVITLFVAYWYMWNAF